MSFLKRVKQVIHILSPFTKKNLFGVLGIVVFGLSFFIFSKSNVGDKTFIALLTSSQAQIADSLHTCFAKTPYGEKMICLKQTLPLLFKNYGIEPTVTGFEKTVTKAGETGLCHQAGHVIGESLYALNHSAEDAMGQCTSACHFGCQHGVLGALMRQKKIEGSSTGEANILSGINLVELCANNNKSKTQGGFRICIHGLGHSFMLARSGELPAALQDCDALNLDRPFNRLCWSGVFMENKTNLMGGGYVYIKPNDPLYPCTMKGLDPRYISVCYRQLGLPLDRGFAICETASEEWQTPCKQGVGMSASGQYADFPNKIVEACTSKQSGINIPCLQTAVAYLIDGITDNTIEQFSDPRVQRLCSFLGDETAKKVCVPMGVDNRP